MENRNWKEIKLGDYLDSISKTFKFTDKEVVFLNTSDVLEGKVLNKEYESPIGLPGQAKKSIQKGDLLFSEIRPANKRYARIDFDSEDYVVSTKLMVLRVKGDLDPIFLELYLTSEEILDYLQMIAEDRSGTFPQITFDIISKLELKLPPLPEQKAIASVLSSLDDKIDLLHQQNQTLEALAETLFRQWFIVDAKEDWEERPLSFFGKIICGKTPSKKQSSFFNGIHPFIKIPDMHGKTFVFETSDTLTEEGLKSQFNKTIPDKSINVSCIATVGLVTMNAHISQTNQQINSIIPIDVFRYYIYCQMKNSFELLQAMASGGTATPNLNTGDFSKISIPNPDNDILKKFNTEVSPIFDKIFENSKQIQTLTKLRDTLLPKLMSGEVRVKMQTD